MKFLFTIENIGIKFNIYSPLRINSKGGWSYLNFGGFSDLKLTFL